MSSYAVVRVLTILDAFELQERRLIDGNEIQKTVEMVIEIPMTISPIILYKCGMPLWMIYIFFISYFFNYLKCYLIK